MKNYLAYFFIFLLVACKSNSFGENYLQNRFNFKTSWSMTMDEVIGLIIEAERKKQLRVKEEKESKIYKKY